jgi:hypothetical protein
MDKRIAWEMFYPDGKHEVHIQPVKDIKGFGRWIYCKYCYKNVRPQISGLNQIVCSECGYGLTPDFYSFKALKIYRETDDFDLASDEDMKSPERKLWFAERGMK